VKKPLRPSPSTADKHWDVSRHDDRARTVTRRRLISWRVALLATAVALTAAACFPAPETSGGLVNGELPASALVTITPSCQIWAPAAPDLTSMIAAAKSDGVNLSPESCYRTYAQQITEREYWCGLGMCQFAAVPGTSVHGWGKAVDFADQNGELTFTSVGYIWLKAHAATYCFVHPAWAEPTGSAPEPWHWEWTC
jgi:hypothetical protein